jgi:hypothetical protein
LPQILTGIIVVSNISYNILKWLFEKSTVSTTGSCPPQRIHLSP